MAIHSSIPAWRIPTDRGAWRATVHGVTKSRTRLKQLSTHAIFKNTPHLLSSKLHSGASVQEQFLLGTLSHHRATCPLGTRRQHFLSPPVHFWLFVCPLGFFKLQVTAFILKQSITLMYRTVLWTLWERERVGRFGRMTL